MQRNSRCLYFVTAVVLWSLAQGRAQAATEALDWNSEGQRNITCIYGEVTVLASVKGIYFCGAQWGGVVGYCGIQDLNSDRRTIFSIWDTSPAKHPKTTEADAQTEFNRFGGEGEGGHTHMVWPWKNGETVRFFLHKRPGSEPNTTDTRYYFFDRSDKKWRHMATINSPNGTRNRGTTFAGVASWIENIGGQADFAKPKVVRYSLWIGSNPDKMKHLTRTRGQSGSGRWGQLQGAYFLAEGSAKELADFFAEQKSKYGEPMFGVDGKELPPIKDTPFPASVIEELKSLPHAPAARRSPRARST
jgi:hypothetical protein